MIEKRFSLRKRLRSFKYAFNGLWLILEEEHNSRIHCVAAILAIGLGLFLKINQMEWFVIIVSIGFVFAMELVNSSIENLSDLVTKEKNDLVRKAKDQGAAAVLVASFVSLIIGTWIFLPKILLVF